MHSHFSKRKTNIANEKSEIICRSVLTCNDVSSIINLNYKSNEKTPKLSFSAKFQSVENEDNNDAAAWSNDEHDIISHL